MSSVSHSTCQREKLAHNCFYTTMNLEVVILSIFKYCSPFDVVVSLFEVSNRIFIRYFSMFHSLH